MRKLLVVLTIVLSMLFSTTVASAASDPNVILINPAFNSTVYSNNLLISVKLSQPRTIKVSVYEEKQVVNGTLSAVNVSTLTTSNGSINNASFTSVPVTAATFTSKNNLSFYTKQVNNLKPGLYRIQIDTLDGSESVTYTSNSYVAVKEKAEEAEAKIFDTPQSGTMQFLQNLLKTIFGD